MADKLPYAIMARLQELAGDRPSTNFIPTGNRRPSPQALSMRKAYHRPLTPALMSRKTPEKLESKYEFSASIQDLVDFGLIRHGYWHDGDLQTTTYGFHLTDKAVEVLAK